MIEAAQPLALGLEPLVEFLFDLDDRALQRIHLAAHDLRVSHAQPDRPALPGPDRLFLDPLEIRERLAGAELFLQELIPARSQGFGEYIEVLVVIFRCGQRAADSLA